MADRQVTVRISAQDSFSTVLEKYNREMGQAEQSTNRANQATQQAQGGFNALSGAIKGAIGAIALNQVIGMAEDMNRLGTEVRANRAIFDQLTESMGGQDRVIRALRASTGGVVDDLTLMGAANQLLRLNIVDNTEDLGKLVGQIQRLKDPTESTTDAIRNFALMLSNESLLRLDSFGISSAAVKRSMDELGISFREAVQIEMDKQIERLGDAADVAQTNLAKLQNILENVRLAASANIATGVDSVAGFILAVGENLAPGGAAYDDYTEYMRMLERGQQMFPEVGAGQKYTDAQWVAIERAANAQKNQTEAVKQFVEAIRGGLGVVREWYQEQARGLINADRMAEQRQPFTSGLSFLRGDLAYLNQETGGGNFRFMTRENADHLQTVFESMKAKAQEIKDSMGDLLTDDDLSILDRYVEQAKQLAGAANDAAKAFEKLSLADILGTSSGGIIGEITDDLLAAGQAAGWSADKLKEYKDALDLASGRQTPMSRAYQSDLIPALMALPPDQAAQAAQYFEQSMRLAAQNNVPFSNLNQFGLGSFAGLFGTGGQQIQVEQGDNLYALAGRYGGNWKDYQSLLTNGILRTGTYNMGGGSLDQNFDPESFMQSIMGTLNNNVGEGGSFGLGGLGTAMQDAEDSASQIDVHMTSIGDTITTFSSNLEGAFGKTYTLNLDVVANLPDWLKSAIRDGTSLVELVGAAVQNNGGVTPGATSNTPRSSRVIEEN